MARSEARIFTSIWSDLDFRDLPATVQRLYFLALSQPTLSLCGVVSFTPRRWAGLAPDTTAESVTTDMKTLADRRYVVVDDDTEELWIRTFLKYDIGRGLFRSDNLIVATAKDFVTIASDSIRQGVADQLAEGVAEGFPEGFPEGLAERLPEGFLKGLANGSPEGSSRTRAPSPGFLLPADSSRLPSSAPDSNGRKRPSRPHRLPDDFEVTDKMREWASESTNLSPQRVRAETDRFCDYWRGCGRTKVNWEATWRNWLRRADEQASQRGPGHRSPSSRDPGAALELAAQERDL